MKFASMELFGLVGLLTMLAWMPTTAQAAVKAYELTEENFEHDT